MAGLERGVLPVVGEAEQLALVGRQCAAAGVHPAQRARHQQGRRRAAALGRQARQLVDLARLHRRLIAAGRAEAELARQEPGARPVVPDGAGRIDGQLLGRVWTRLLRSRASRRGPVSIQSSG